MRIRNRTVLQAAQSGGLPCPDLAEAMECNTHVCPTDCLLSSWSRWSSCSSSCGGGTRRRFRTQIRAPQNGGRGCDELMEEVEKCNTQE